MTQNGSTASSTVSQIIRWTLTALVTVVLFLAVWEVHTTLLLVLAAIILCVLFTMPIRFMVRRGIGRGTATMLSLVGIIAIIVLIFMLVLPSLLTQFSRLASTVQEGVQEVAAQWEELQADPQLREAYPGVATVQDFIKTLTGESDLDNILNDLGGQLGQAAGQLGGSVLPVVSGVASTLLSLIIVIFLSLYFLSEPQMYEEGAIKLFPIWYRDRVRFIISRIDFTLRIWLQGQILLMIIVGVVTWIGLALLGIDQALALGVLAGLFSFVPNFGPIAALIPSLAVGFVQAPQSIGWIVVIIYGTSFLQSQLVAPLLFKESINLPPVLVLIGQIFAAIFFGFLGIMLAVPIIAILMILVQEVYVKDILHDRVSEPQYLTDDELVPDGS
ncbi:MAG: AI-2E family transporter [Anaerolineae bacterium]|nr:AI-2E family transporter [Anaerolineae bacterium]MBN8617699.1 AI-2E family transporter [Anaerolineae bacterium]